MRWFLVLYGDAEICFAMELACLYYGDRLHLSDGPGWTSLPPPIGSKMPTPPAPPTLLTPKADDRPAGRGEEGGLDLGGDERDGG
eukprot:CAMPEP_0119537782 /NCGR_PEP_ID=MMETSP1344-20130328/50357_1 /TAXON_ID=236787 /ORGANISM="Florenciella parvula, Strain CCMP2471" /LENGTH=84 /DNA_ID=CAMNT_0007580399 /DNA_START=100 /DNA_END=352 /DNA_ORIENTATION=+